MGAGGLNELSEDGDGLDGGRGSEGEGRRNKGLSFGYIESADSPEEHELATVTKEPLKVTLKLAPETVTDRGKRDGAKYPGKGKGKGGNS